jgi:hypothetical protein
MKDLQRTQAALFPKTCIEPAAPGLSDAVVRGASRSAVDTIAERRRVADAVIASPRYAL